MVMPTHFTQPLELLAPDALTHALQRALGEFKSVTWSQSTGSTNGDLVRRIKTAEGLAMPCLEGAHVQSAAKGRAARPWKNISGNTLMFSCAFAPEIPLARLPGLSPALGVVACLALRQLFEPLIGRDSCQNLTLKWPNDLQWGQGKLAGILVETAQRSGASHPCVVVGIGLNLLGARTLTTQLGRDVTDVSEILVDASRVSKGTVAGLCPSAIVIAIAKAWQKALDVYCVKGYAAFQELFNSVDVLALRSVDVIDQGLTLQTGIAQGTDAFGRLLVRTETAVVPILVGDVSVRRHVLPEPTATLKGT